MRLKCLFYTAWIFALLLYQSCSHQDNETKDISIALGSSVEIPCPGGSEWKHNASFRVSSPALHLHNTSLDDRGFYTCHNSNGEVLRAVRLQLGYPPPQPDVQCWSPSYPLKALCSWTLPQDPILPTYYISTYGRLDDTYSCQSQSEQDRQCVLEDLELYSNMPYLVNITAVNALGSSSRLVPVIFEDIVKPDPPVSVKATALPGKKLRVQWAPPPSWPDPVTFPLKYKVQFQWGDTNTTNIMGPYESESMVRSGAMPGRTYRIRVSVMDLLGHGQSSDWSDGVNITLPRT